jgi:hypothetical protein
MATSKKNAPPSREITLALCAVIASYALYSGRQAGLLPVNAGWRFFSWHPFLMITSISLSTVSACRSIHKRRHPTVLPFEPYENTTKTVEEFNFVSQVAALIKKLGGYTNTQAHGALSFASVLSMAAGYYVIWSNKEAMNKPHITSNHSYAGVR